MKTVAKKPLTYLALALALVATGCIAQSGTEETQTSSSQLVIEQQGNGGSPGQLGVAKAIAAQPGVVIAHGAPVLEQENANTPNTGDPSNGESGGDGQDPQPVPWHNNEVTSSRSH
jgi:hypothetical protein